MHLQASFDAGSQGVMSEKCVPGVSNKTARPRGARLRYDTFVSGTYDLGIMLRETSAGELALNLLYLGRGLNSTIQAALGAYDWWVVIR